MEPVYPSKQDTLREAVARLVDSGLADPVTITTRLVEEYGQEWLRRQLVNVVAMLAAGGSVSTGHADVKVVPGVPRVQRAAAGADVFSGSVWVDGKWKPLGDLTAKDCRTVSTQYARLAQAAERHRDWFLSAAELVEREGGAILRDVRELLPVPRGQSLSQVPESD